MAAGSAARPSLKPIARIEGEGSEELDEVGSGGFIVDRRDQRIRGRVVPAGVRTSFVSVLRQGWCVYRNASGMRADPMHTRLPGLDVCDAFAQWGDPSTAVPGRRRLDDRVGVRVAGLAVVSTTVQLFRSAELPARFRHDCGVFVDRCELDPADMHAACDSPPANHRPESGLYGCGEQLHANSGGHAKAQFGQSIDNEQRSVSAGDRVARLEHYPRRKSQLALYFRPPG